MKILIEDDLQFHIRTTAQKIKFSINNFFSKSDQIADLVTFTGEILNGKLHFFVQECSLANVEMKKCNVRSVYLSRYIVMEKSLQYSLSSMFLVVLATFRIYDSSTLDHFRHMFHFCTP